MNRSELKARLGSRYIETELNRDVAFLCGLRGNNTRPLTDEEIIHNARSNKAFSLFFKPVADVILEEKQPAKEVH